jgi:hypothetical protein
LFLELAIIGPNVFRFLFITMIVCR